MKLKSYVGGHSLNIYINCNFDPSIRKYRGGQKIAEIPYSGTMLSVKVKQEIDVPIRYEGVSIPTMTPQMFESVDPLPSKEECDYCIVSAMYVAACKYLGLDTSRLLTIGIPVVDDDNRVIGCVGLNRN